MQNLMLTDFMLNIERICLSLFPNVQTSILGFIPSDELNYIMFFTIQLEVDDYNLSSDYVVVIRASFCRQSSSEKTPSQRLSSEFFESFQSLKLKSSDQRVSPAMSSLQGYYGLKPTEQKSRIDGFEMALYRKGASHYLEDMPISGTSQHSDLLTHHHRKSKSLVNGFLGEKGDVGDLQSAEAGDGDPKWSDKLIRRRQKSVADFSHSPEMLLKDDNSSGGSNGFSSSVVKGLLAQRPKTSSRTNLASDNEVGLIPIPIGLGDSFVAADGFAAFRKSSSTSSLPDQENGITSSIWSQAISTASRPIFDGLPKPLTGRRNKAALD